LLYKRMNFNHKHAYHISDLKKELPSTNKDFPKNAIKGVLESRQHTWSNEDSTALIANYTTNSIAANAPIEDSHVELVSGSQGFFGVFDGHSGDKTAELAANNLVPLFRSVLCSERQKQLAVLNNATKGQRDHPLQACVSDPDCVRRAVESEQNENKRNALRQLSISGVVQSTLHRAFVDHDLRQVKDSLSGAGGLSLSGACALLTHVMGDHLFVANAGDCRAVLGHCEANQGKEIWSAVPLSADHRLDNEAEKARVVASHPGESDIVKDGRVKGSLMPTRGFGDFAFKLKCLKPVLMKADSLWNPPYITADPEVHQHKLCVGDKFLVMASDGLWEQFSNLEVVKMVADALQCGTNACTYLIEKTLAKALGTDNSDVITNILHMDPKSRRQYHDDVTISIVFFNTSNLASHSIDRVWKQDTNFTVPYAPAAITVPCGQQQSPMTMTNSPVNDEASGSVRAHCLVTESPKLTHVRANC